ALLVDAFDLADRRRDHHHAGVAVEALMMREANVLLVLDLFAVLVLGMERRLLAKLHPRALVASGRCRSGAFGSRSTGRGSLSSGSSGRRFSCRILRECWRTSYHGGQPESGAHGRDP